MKRYYDAGGNGVAMRVLPHVLRLGEKEFPKVATNIFLDGIATHGHPRALVGALAYGFSLWAAFRKDSKLAYGELVEELIKNVDLWSALPTTPGILQEWRSQAEKSLQDYMKLWESAKAEVMEYLEVCRTELSKGALSLDDDVLKKLQCFNSKINGAGTVAAVASVYLASRHAADPINGVVKAAFAIGSDTDTIASMTGGLLGCVNGTGWLSSIKQGIQDAPYVEKCASCLAVGHVAGGTNTEAIRRTFLKKWIDDVFAVPDSREIYLPDRRMAKVSRGTDQVGRSGKFKVEFLKFTSEDGQTIYINKISKGNFGIQQTSRQSLTSELCSKTPERQLQLQLLPKQSIFGPKLPVASMEKSIDFYKDLLGFTIKKESREAVVFHQGLVLVPASYTKTFPGDGFRTLLYVEVADVPNRFKTVAESSATIVTKIGNWGQSARRFFRCLDPDGNLIEVFEKI